MIVVVSINNHIVSTYDQIEEIFGVANVALKVFHNTNYAISTSNHVFGRAIWGKLPVCIFENFEIARVKWGQFQNFQKSWGWFIPKMVRTEHVIIG